jgi:hypothetical protein
MISICQPYVRWEGLAEGVSKAKGWPNDPITALESLSQFFILFLVSLTTFLGLHLL